MSLCLRVVSKLGHGQCHTTIDAEFLETACGHCFEDMAFFLSLMYPSTVRWILKETRKLKLLKSCVLKQKPQMGVTVVMSRTSFPSPYFNQTYCALSSKPALCHSVPVPVKWLHTGNQVCAALSCRLLSGTRSTKQVNKSLKDDPVRRRHTRNVLIERDDWLSVQQWKQMKAAWLNERHWVGKVDTPRTIFEFELAALETVAIQEFSLTGQSLFAFIRDENVQPNHPLISKCLFMCVSCKDEDGLLWCVDWLEDSQRRMDKGTIANIISGLCLTDRWRESRKFVAKADAMDCMSARILEPYTIAACEHGDRELAGNLLEDHIQRDLMPSEASCLRLLSTFGGSAEMHCVEENERIVRRLLDYMKEKRHYPPKSVAEELGTWFKSKANEKWEVSHTEINPEGICKSCKNRLELLKLDQAEFDNLREEIFLKVIRGGDVFRKTTPQELEAFMEFVDSGPTYDIVLDGLNVANIKKRRTPGRVLRQFVEHLARGLGLRCLVLGRHHMLKQQSQYERRDMAVIQDLADCFFTQNMSEDDPFMLYATLHSGVRTQYISRDMLRDHKALLSPRAHLAFIKWQRSHQLVPVDLRDGKAVFEKILAHDTVIQCTESSWHIPYDDGSPRFSYEVPLTWLCATRDDKQGRHSDSQ